MKGYIENIEQATMQNDAFRRVLYTAKNCQLTIMALKPSEDIGQEVHDVDQFLRIEKGSGTAILDGVEHSITEGSVIIVPAGTTHNIINASTTEPMKLYTLYSPPHHRDGVVHQTKADAETDSEHFDGNTTEK
ncbi:MAG TPA: cupin domain-containing protein [Candidatus Andersenbacteria bacterium]|nr:cupin domain-containing protein [Candidatus Andersenbacteria bacterium]